MTKLIRLFFLNILLILICSWGFYAHKTINKHAVFALPSQMNTFFIYHINDLEEGGVRADKRRLRKAVFAIASFWYSAWVDAGQPDLSKLKYENKVDNINEKQLLIPKRKHE